jgi:hypothetical protein
LLYQSLVLMIKIFTDKKSSLEGASSQAICLVSIYRKFAYCFNFCFNISDDAFITFAI